MWGDKGTAILKGIGDSGAIRGFPGDRLWGGPVLETNGSGRGHSLDEERQTQLDYEGGIRHSYHRSVHDAPRIQRQNPRARHVEGRNESESETAIPGHREPKQEDKGTVIIDRESIRDETDLLPVTMHSQSAELVDDKQIRRTEQVASSAKSVDISSFARVIEVGVEGDISGRTQQPPATTVDAEGVSHAPDVDRQHRQLPGTARQGPGQT